MCYTTSLVIINNMGMTGFDSMILERDRFCSGLHWFPIPTGAHLIANDFASTASSKFRSLKSSVASAARSLAPMQFAMAA